MGIGNWSIKIKNSTIQKNVAHCVNDITFIVFEAIELLLY
jgi:hypothetical protein